MKSINHLSAISGFSVRQRLQRPSEFGSPRISERVGDREAAEAAENAEAADEQQLVCRGGDKDDGGLTHDSIAL
jgi:hypothetical protein